ncbi:hypothetical protein NSPZN2_11392 [Nitrospira defluvii]|uniref:Uncharacterized protein n=1 Tax=Nitrospira defluvii TaxID=330214 RepID=A0ABN7KZ10_9BACT|nr:hypothetical protein NSPZN2_11392 [Nitrospira defluvii]
MMVLGAGDATVKLAADSGHAGQDVSIELFDPQARLDHQPVDWPVKIASAGQVTLQWIETILPAGGCRIVAPAVFQKQEPSVWLEDPPNFAQRSQRIRDRAEREGADCAVERAIVVRQLLCGHMLEMDRKWGARDSLRHTIGKERGGVDRIQGGDGSRVMRQVQSGSKADLHHVAMRSDKQTATLGLETLSPEHPIHESREDVGRVHGVGGSRRWMREPVVCRCLLRI